MFFKRSPQRILELGPDTLIDLNQVSGVYTEGNLLVIRIGGMGVIKLERSQLFNKSIHEAYQSIRTGLGL